MIGSYNYTVGRRYAEVAKRAGKRVAFRFENGEEVTHQEFNGAVNRTAAALQRKGLRRRDVIAIVHDKSLACYALMMAALKLGVAYVNVDDQNPAPRLKHIFDTARPKIVFAPSANAVLVAAGEAGLTCVELDAEYERLLNEMKALEPVPGDQITGSDAAYIMYTSGSTGVPKGAVITHAAVLNFVDWIGTRFELTEHDVMTNLNPMYFDNSVFDFYGAIVNGITLAPISRETLANASRIAAATEAARCTIWFSVPSLLIYMMAMKALAPNRLSTIRSFVFGGEGYPKPELRRLFEMYRSQAKLINVYGPTECTCMCSAWDVRQEDLEDSTGFVTLGTIADNFDALVLDGEDEVQPGHVGELCLLGPQVGLGYMNDPERTLKAFVPNPLNRAWAEPMYRTGDLVRARPDGMLDFVGRKDNQLKHMGYRIEPEEIEAAINRIQGVAQSAVLQRANKRGVKQLVAYLAADREYSEGDLREELALSLPPYMIPQRFVLRASLPKNANGKVDRVVLASEPFE